MRTRRVPGARVPLPARTSVVPPHRSNDGTDERDEPPANGVSTARRRVVAPAAPSGAHEVLQTLGRVTQDEPVLVGLDSVPAGLSCPRCCAAHRPAVGVWGDPVCSTEGFPDPRPLSSTRNSGDQAGTDAGSAR